MWAEEQRQAICEKIDSFRGAMIEMQRKLSAIPAISPKSGGEGEKEKATFLKANLEDAGFEVEEFRAPDESAPCGYRPSLLATLSGSIAKPAIWVMTHIDVVPPGTEKLWETDPYEVVEKDGKLYGRGVEDNQQSLVASLFAAKALKELALTPAHTLKLLFVADEETGSRFGVEYLLREHSLFDENDIIFVPDGGVPDGTMIEVAEKSILWLKMVTKGKQCHASDPGAGNNAHRAAAHLLLRIDERLRKQYPGENNLFQPPLSTFEPTKKESNVDNVNTIPGEDVFYFDCRLLPDVDVDAVIESVKETAGEIEDEFGVSISVELVQREDAAPATSPESRAAQLVKQAVKEVYNVEAKPQGIGGGTVAALLRKQGLSAVVWSKIDKLAHQPNEYCRIDNMVGDAKVFALIYGEE